MNLTSDCCKGFIDEGTPKGKTIKLGAEQIDCYVAEPSTPKSADRCIMIATDVFGWTLVNVRLMADAFAEEGFLAVVPDMFEGSPIPPETLDMDAEYDQPQSIVDRIGRSLSLGWILLSTGIPWFIQHLPNKGISQFRKVLNEVQIAYPEVKSIGIVGFCYGGKIATELSIASKENEIVTAVSMAHPAVSYPQDIQTIGKPTIIHLSEHDRIFGVKQVEGTRSIAREKTEEGCIVDVYWYEGTQHGFAVRGGKHIPTVKEARELCFTRTVDFMNKYLTKE